MMADSYTIKDARQKFSAVVQEAADHPVTITNQGRAVAVVMSIERLEAIAETMELLADPKAMAAIRKHRVKSRNFGVKYPKFFTFSPSNLAGGASRSRSGCCGLGRTETEGEKRDAPEE